MFATEILLLSAALMGHCTGAVSASTPDHICAELASCQQCQLSSDTCGWCSTAASPLPRCMALAANNSSVCDKCEPVRSRPARQATSSEECDPASCRGLKDEVCSGHGTCRCGKCICDIAYRGALCQNCPGCWGEQCLRLADCARCVKNERNATKCAVCPPDTQLLQTKLEVEPPDASTCVFDSISIAEDSRCSFRVHYWHDDKLAIHTRIELLCGAALDTPPFGGALETSTVTGTGISPNHGSTSSPSPNDRPPPTSPVMRLTTSSALSSTQMAESTSRPPTAGQNSVAARTRTELLCLMVVVTSMSWS